MTQAPSAHAASPLLVIARDIKLSHSVFALPFALLATFFAAATAGRQPRIGELGLIVACMFFARSFAMLANRYVDRRLDAANPRTAGRALPSGRLTAAQVIAAMVASAVAFLAAAGMFWFLYENIWPILLAPAVLLWLGLYGLVKRFSLLCHLFLGLALAISPPAAALAIEPTSLAHPAMWWLSGFVALWVAGFDIIYAMQDIDVDRRDGLHSIPARFGETGALILAKLAHLAALLMVIMAERSTALLDEWFFYGVAVVGILLIVEHKAASARRFSMAFFTLNGVISLALAAAGIADILIRTRS